MIRVAIVDDHPVVADGIAANLERGGDVEIVGSAATAAEALALVERRRPDVVVLDLELPDGSGLDAIAPLIAAGARVVVFSAYAGEERVGLAFARGAGGYVVKGTPSAELVETVCAVAAGDARVSPAVANDLAAALRAPARERLTEREREILRLVAEGLANKEIAARLGISERTVKFHVGEILGRLGAPNRARAVALAQQRGLL
jgi:DNA-binding NarL/FixJ family response regulator